MRPGQEERIEFEYIRHGVVCLIASFDVVTGKSLSPTIGPTRNEEDYLEHIKRTFALHPDSKWRFIADQLNTHWSAGLVLWVIMMEGLTLSPEEVGAKGKSEILKNQKARQSPNLALSEFHIWCKPRSASLAKLNQVVNANIRRRRFRRSRGLCCRQG